MAKAKNNTVKDDLKINPEKNIQNNLKEGEHGEVIIGRKFAVQFDFTYKGRKGKKMDSVSETVPDMNLTVKQILQNHTRGIDGKETIRQPLYFETEVPNITDITDVYEYKDYLETQVQRVEEFITQEKAEAEKQKGKEEAAAAAEKTSEDPTEE